MAGVGSMYTNIFAEVRVPGLPTNNLLNTYFAKQLTSMSIIIESIIAASCKIKVV